MGMISKAHLVDYESCTARGQVHPIDRQMTTDLLEMRGPEGQARLAAGPQHLVNGQCQGIATMHAHCDLCDARLNLKGLRQRKVRTVFGLIGVNGPCVQYCRYMRRAVGASFKAASTSAQSRVKRRAVSISPMQARTCMSAKRVVLLQDKAVPCGPVYEISQAFDDARVKSLGLAVMLPRDADDCNSSTAGIANPVFLKAMLRVLRHAELGLDTVQRTALRAAGVV